MIELLVALAPTLFPRTWANDYCVNLGYGSYTHEQSLALANTSNGEMTPEAWEFTKTNTWCLDLIETDD